MRPFDTYLSKAKVSPEYLPNLSVQFRIYLSLPPSTNHYFHTCENSFCRQFLRATNMASGPLYIGFDLSTQQLKGLVVSSDLKVEYEAKFDFDAHSHGFDIKKGVMTNEAEHEVFAPVALWLQALDSVLNTLKDQGLDFGRVKGISGAGQQHGSVYWSKDAERLLQGLQSEKTLEEQLAGAFSHPFSPNWQDASTQRECDEFDAYLGGPEELADVTGSKAHHVRVHLCWRWVKEVAS